jgi:hypothetical protein
VTVLLWLLGAFVTYHSDDAFDLRGAPLHLQLWCGAWFVVAWPVYAICSLWSTVH